MVGYSYDSSDVLLITFNGLMAVEGQDYLLDTSKTPVEININLVGSTNIINDIDIKVLKSKIGFS